MNQQGRENEVYLVVINRPGHNERASRGVRNAVSLTAAAFFCKIKSCILTFKIIFSYVERNRNSKLVSTHLRDGSGSKNYLFSQRLRDDDISLCDSLLDFDSTSKSQKTRIIGAKRPGDSRRKRGNVSVDMRQSTRTSDRQRTEENLAGKRKWRQHEGRNRFFCNGRVMTTRQSSIFLLTLFLIVATFVMFCVFDAPYLTRNVSVLLPIVGGILFAIVISSLLKTTFTDPGVIPRPNNREVIEFDRQCAENADPNSRVGVAGNANAARVKIITIKGQTVKLKFCFTCRLYRPPRASHCSICDNCVMNFDHHCPWVGNCIGQRNYRYFYFFITSLAVLDLFVGACTTVHLALETNETKAFIETIRNTPVSLVVALICVISIWSIVGLSGFHTYLIATSQTTNEDIKGTFNTKLRPSVRNPYTTGNFCKNIYYALCGSEPPSLIDRRGMIEPNIMIKVDANTLQRFTAAADVQNVAAELMEISEQHNENSNSVPEERTETVEDEIDDVDDTECMPRHSFTIPTPHCNNSTTQNHKDVYRKSSGDLEDNTGNAIPMQKLGPQKSENE
uniref:Palmitoyltransferase n=1 Tax=Panagrolaimus sp. JU765 TaxID=591449 RepID=A0AC34Q1B6_9BILA